MLKFLIETDIVISAPTQSVWNVLTDISKYAEWNPFIPYAQGDLNLGSKISILIHPLGIKNQKYKVKITDLNRPRVFSWRGHFLVPGLIDGNHTFELASLSERETKLIHREVFTGALVPFVWKSFIIPRLKPGFGALNESLKQYVEKKASE